MEDHPRRADQVKPDLPGLAAQSDRQWHPKITPHSSVGSPSTVPPRRLFGRATRPGATPPPRVRQIIPLLFPIVRKTLQHAQHHRHDPSELESPQRPC